MPHDTRERSKRAGAGGILQENKVEIAATLRERAAQLTSVDLASEAVAITDHVVDASAALPSPETGLPLDAKPALGDFRVAKPATKKRRKKADSNRDSGSAEADK